MCGNGLDLEVSMRRYLLAAALRWPCLRCPGGAAQRRAAARIRLSAPGTWSTAGRCLDNRTVIVTDRLRQRFRLTLAGACHDLQFPIGAGLQDLRRRRPVLSARNDSVWCRRRAIRLPRQRCLITDIEAYTPAMDNADAMAEGCTSAHGDRSGLAAWRNLPPRDRHDGGVTCVC